MSTVPKKTEAPGFAVETVSRKPQQNRSHASLERMLVAARELMLERGEDFTLQEVSRRGDVSIGSIYLRFESKENLVRAVIANALDDVARDEEDMCERVRESASSLAELVPAYVHAYAETLRGNASLLRLAMQRAAIDPLVSEPGKQRALQAAKAGSEVMLDYRDEFGGTDPELKASSAFHVIFATLARQLSLGSTGESVQSYDWDLLKRELGSMCLAYLKSPD
ncbi:MAG: TetR/AcrR family transcriptional regulator [Sphingomicrobium sp.]